MQQEPIQAALFAALAERYELDPTQFVTLPQQSVDSSLTRVAVAELRNEGYVEEQVRGVIRLTARGYMLYKNTAPDRLAGWRESASRPQAPKAPHEKKDHAMKRYSSQN